MPFELQRYKGTEIWKQSSSCIEMISGGDYQHYYNVCYIPVKALRLPSQLATNRMCDSPTGTHVGFDMWIKLWKRHAWFSGSSNLFYYNFLTVSIFISGHLESNFRFTSSKDITELCKPRWQLLYCTVYNLVASLPCPTPHSSKQVKIWDWCSYSSCRKTQYMEKE